MVLIFVWFYALNQYVNLKGWGMKWKLNCTVYTIIMIFLDIPYLFLQILIIEKITWPGPSFHSPSLLSNKPLYMILLHLNQLFDLLSEEKNIMSFLFLYSTDNKHTLQKDQHSFCVDVNVHVLIPQCIHFLIWKVLPFQSLTFETKRNNYQKWWDPWRIQF